MEAAKPGEDCAACDAANMSLDKAAARAHACRERTRRAAKDPHCPEHEAAKNRMAQDAKRAAAARAERQAEAEPERNAKVLALRIDQRQRASAIAKLKAKHKARRQTELEAKQVRDEAEQVRDALRKKALREGLSSLQGEWKASGEAIQRGQKAYVKAMRARVRMGQRIRALGWAPKHMVDEAEDLLAQGGVVPELPPPDSATAGGRVLPSLVKLASPQKPKPTRFCQFPKYHRRLIGDKTVETGSKVGPMAVPVPAWKRAKELYAFELHAKGV